MNGNTFFELFWGDLDEKLTLASYKREQNNEQGRTERRAVKKAHFWITLALDLASTLFLLITQHEVPFIDMSEATKSVEKPNREPRRLVNTFTCSDYDPADVIGLDKNTAMPSANLKTITDDVTLILPYSCIRDCISLYQNSHTHTAPECCHLVTLESSRG